jgi:DNA-directed RNA polymerase specialized sigma24 family protein
LAKLSSEVRLCVVLAYNEGMSHSEIAQLTNLPVGTVKSHISRGAARLREMLATYAGS